MRVFLLAALVIISGCVRTRQSPAVTVDSERPLSPQMINSITNALEHSPTFLDLKRHTAKPMVVFDNERDGWVMVDIGNWSKDSYFFHRWATLKVQTNTGAILKLGTDEKSEDKWLVEFQPTE